MTPGWLLLDGGQIRELGTGGAWADLVGDTTVVVDGRSRIVAPGFVDIHCHGGGGGDFSDASSDLESVLAFHVGHGTTSIVASLVTATIESLHERLAALARVVERRGVLVGIHLEGPYLAPGHRGAHAQSLLKMPDPREVESLIAAAAGALAQVTMAPELPGATDAMSRFLSAGVCVAVGHTDADYDASSGAFRAGASILTHAFNGMPGIHHREPGPVAAAVNAEGAVLEVIADGVHVHDSVVRTLFSLAPGRVALVTDAMAAAGAGDGSYVLGETEVVVRDHVAMTADGRSIAGSTLSMDAAVRRVVLRAGVDLGAALAAATAIPAAAVNKAHEIGSLATGRRADVVMLDANLHVDEVWTAGWRRSSTVSGRRES